MKTQIKYILLALSLAAVSSTRAEEYVYVDVDGDGYLDAVPASQPVAVNGPQICGGADDDQIVGGDGADFAKPVLKGLVSDTLGIATGNAPLAAAAPSSIVTGAGAGGGPHLSPDPAQWPVGIVVTNPGEGGILTEKPESGIVVTNPGEGGILTEKPESGIVVTNPGEGGILTKKPESGIILTDPGEGGILTEKPESGIVVTNPGEGGILTDQQIDLLIMNALRLGPICGGNGNDSLRQMVSGGAAVSQQHPAPTHSSTSQAADAVLDEIILELMTTGRFTGDSMDDDDLWGGGGTDEVVIGNPSGGSI